MDETPPITTLANQLFNALLSDRKRERRKTYFKYSVLGLLAFLVWKSGSLPEKTYVDGPYAALIHVTGEIMPGKGASAEAINPLLEEAFEDPNATAVVLLVNSPGGTPVQASLIHDRIKALKRDHPGKAVVAVGEDMVTSGAYMVAAAADQIVVNRSTVAGSIGVITRGFGFTGLMNKLGIERRVLTAGESKNMDDPFGPVTDKSLSKQKDLLQQIHGHFIDTVKTGRGERLKLDTPGLFSGTVWTGEQAVEYGLADELGDLASVKKALNVTHFREISTPGSLIQSFVDGIGTKVSTELSARVQGPLALPE